MIQHNNNVDPMDSKNDQKDEENESKKTGDQAENQINPDEFQIVVRYANTTENWEDNQWNTDVQCISDRFS